MHDCSVFPTSRNFSITLLCTSIDKSGAKPRGSYNGRDFLDVFVLIVLVLTSDCQTSSVEGSSVRVTCACFGFKIPRGRFLERAKLSLLLSLKY